MNCIQLHCNFLPLHSNLIHKQQVNNNQRLVCLSTHESTNNKVTLHTQNTASSHQQWRTKAISDSLVLGVTSPAKPDISVLIQTSAVLVFFYGIANFVVPYFVSKDLGLDEDQKLDDDEDDGPSKDEAEATSNIKTSQTQKQDFDRTKV